MRDEIDGRVWNDNHDQLSQSIGNAIDAAADGLRRLPGSVRHLSGQLLALLMATGLTVLTFDAYTV